MVSSIKKLFFVADDWLTEIFGYPVYRLGADGENRSLGEVIRSGRVFCYAKVDVSDVQTANELERLGFRIVDTALTFSGNPAGVAGGLTRAATITDREAARGIAGRVFRFSRFHLDPNISNVLADEVKSAWVDNFFVGKRGDGMIVAELDGQLAGFLQLLWAGDQLVIDLIGVDKNSQGRGIGRNMILFAARCGIGDGRVPESMMVGTQAANTASVRLYESLGFRLGRAQYVFHFHNREEGSR